MQNLTLRPGMLSSIKGEPHVLDLHLASNLGFENPYKIRELIARNRSELESYGVFPTVGKTSPQGGRPGKTYYLNEGQALVVCALSRTANAARVRKLLIDVFLAWRAGKLVHVDEHYRKPPVDTKPARRAMFDLTMGDGMARIEMLVPIGFAVDVAKSYYSHCCA